MVKVRQDAWSHEDDLLLAETVLRHIREGSTQLNAFEEVGDKLNRTSAACGFRWNAEVRKRYEQAVSIAKRQRKEKKRAMAKSQKTIHHQTALPQAANMSFDASAFEDSTYMEEDEEQVESSIPVMNTNRSMSLDSVIDYLSTMKHDYYESNRSKKNLVKLEEENKSLSEENQMMHKKVQQLQEQLSTIQEDYQVLIQIMDRARKMVVFDEDGNIPSPAFRMEKNGNLEQVAR
ncbi:RsfA family transcriptional regulator [Radiobacillus sp. PE A8.2]|uniref:RsfA family transcriptional regulator n=1 Tax=Radiobacillus sp. PE A8.2 TaxID=3380349 RepID=UPI00388E494E